MIYSRINESDFNNQVLKFLIEAKSDGKDLEIVC